MFIDYSIFIVLFIVFIDYSIVIVLFIVFIDYSIFIVFVYSVYRLWYIYSVRLYSMLYLQVLLDKKCFLNDILKIKVLYIHLNFGSNIAGSRLFS